MLLKGNDLMLFAHDGEKYTSIAYATNHTLELSADTNFNSIMVQLKPCSIV